MRRASVVLGLVFSTPSREGETSPKGPIFCVEWVVKPRLSLSCESWLCVEQQQMRQPMMMQQQAPGQQAAQQARGMRMAGAPPGAPPPPQQQQPPGGPQPNLGGQGQSGLGQPGLTFNVPVTDEHGNLGFPDIQ